jgi:hypothetical protein
LPSRSGAQLERAHLSVPIYDHGHSNRDPGDRPMSSNIPMLSDGQWRKIEKLLPENRHDSTVIAAILYREFSGQPLRHVGEQYGLSRTRLQNGTRRSRPMAAWLTSWRR